MPIFSALRGVFILIIAGILGLFAAGDGTAPSETPVPERTAQEESHALPRHEEEHGGAFEVACGDVFEVSYPGRLNNCEGCHRPDTYYPVDPAEVMATTIDAGADRSILTDDVAISPNAAVCSGCHGSTVAAEHMKQNGADFEAAKSADGTLISAGVETCGLCHGPGRLADVKELHGVGTFLFN